MIEQADQRPLINKARSFLRRIGIRVSEVPSQQCPCCNYTMDRCTSVTKSTRPKEGDITICISCGKVLQFTKLLKFKQLNEQELKKIKLDDPETFEIIQQAQIALLELKLKIS
jgi:hypothetical protein